MADSSPDLLGIAAALERQCEIAFRSNADAAAVAGAINQVGLTIGYSTGATAAAGSLGAAINMGMEAVMFAKHPKRKDGTPVSRQQLRDAANILAMGSKLLEALLAEQEQNGTPNVTH